MALTPSELKCAKSGPVPVDLESAIGDDGEAVQAELSGFIPDWLAQELACERLSMYKVGPNKWMLAPIDD